MTTSPSFGDPIGIVPVLRPRPKAVPGLGPTAVPPFPGHSSGLAIPRVAPPPAARLRQLEAPDAPVAHGPLGPARTSDDVYPLDEYGVRYQVAGIKPDKDGKADLELTVRLTNADVLRGAKHLTPEQGCEILRCAQDCIQAGRNGITIRGMSRRRRSGPAPHERRVQTPGRGASRPREACAIAFEVEAQPQLRNARRITAGLAPVACPAGGVVADRALADHVAEPPRLDQKLGAERRPARVDVDSVQTLRRNSLKAQSMSRAV